MLNSSNLAINTEQVANENTVANQDNVIHINKNISIGKVLYGFIKRILDIAFGLLGTILLVPLTLIIMIMRAVKKENDGPIFYDQLRIGKNGEQFRLFKFRSMCMNADETLEDYLNENEEAKKEYQKYKKLKNDPRITKVGKFLRATSLDEAPQFINVLFGNMSLVGPRPYLPREKEDMGEYYQTIITCKPGITGYWQVNGRNNRQFIERTYLDAYYIKNKSLALDLKIIVKTIRKVLQKEGAI